MEEVVLVTCVYNRGYVLGEPLANPFQETRWQRFYESLISISRSKAPMVIFTEPGNESFLTKYAQEYFHHQNYQIIPFDITQFEYNPAIEEIKKQNIQLNPTSDRYAQLVLSKSYLMEVAMLHSKYSSTRWYWIDAGLSYVSLFPTRYKTGGQYDWAGYSCFDEKFIRRIKEWGNDKIFVIVFNKGLGTPYMEAEGLYLPGRSSIKHNWYVIGGLWGGRGSQLMDMHREYRVALFNVIDFWRENNVASNRKLFYEEPIMSAMVCNHPEKYNVQRFDTWYHEDDWSQSMNILPGEKSFYKIITGE